MAYCAYRYTKGEVKGERNFCRLREAPCISLDGTDEETRKCVELYSCCGFLAPDGTYFYCEYGWHMREAIRIVKQHFGIEMRNGIDAERFLHEHGYVCLYSRNVYFDHYLNGKKRTLTPEQVQFLDQARRYCPIVEKEKQIRQLLEISYRIIHKNDK